MLLCLNVLYEEESIRRTWERGATSWAASVGSLLLGVQAERGML